MKNFSNLAKLTLVALVALATSSQAWATTFTASTTGNFSSSSTWTGGVAPGTTINSADAIVINTGVTVTLDHSVIMNNAGATFTVNGTGTLTGSASGLTLNSGTLSGAGTINIDSLTIGSAGTLATTGAVTTAYFVNNQTAFSLTSAVNVTNSVVLGAGNLALGTGAALTLATGGTINFAGGTYSTGLGGLFTLGTTVNLLYSGTASSMGAELALLGLNNVSVNLASSSSQINQAGDLIIAGGLNLQSGQLNTNGHNLTIAGGITTAGSASINSTSASSITIGSTTTGSIAFASGGNTVNNLTINAGANGSVALNSGLTVAGSLALTSGTLNISSSTLTLGGSITGVGTGTLSGTSNSTLVLNGAGNQGSIAFAAGAGTIGSLTVNNSGVGGSTSLGSNLTVAGALNLSNGTLNLNGNSLTLGGTVVTTGGTLGGTSSSNLAITGSGNMGTIAFATGSQTLNNVTVNTTGTGASSITLGSNLSVAGTLSLSNGNINTGNFNLALTGAGNISGGSGSSYVATTGTGSLVDSLIAGGNMMFQIGTSANYAPVLVTNNSATNGSFTANAVAGIYANGTTGSDLSATTNSINTSWNVESDITTGANATIEAYWTNSMAVNGFNNTTAYLSHYTAGAWDASTSTSVTNHGGGLYSVSRAGITSFSPFAVYGTNATGINTVAQTPTFSVYPNPAKNAINVAVSDLTTGQQARIFDAIGNEVMNYAVNNMVSTIDISHLPAGVYFVSLNNKYTSRFIKE